MDLSTTFAEIFGEIYGIPNPIPRRIKSNPRAKAKTGTAFVIFLLMLRLINFPNIVTANIVGIVPRPVSYTHLDVYKRQVVSTR